MSKQTALVVGASRGLGLALAEEWLTRGWQVIATARGASSGLDELRVRFPDTLEIERADTVEVGTIAALAKRLQGRALDVLFVNAGIALANDKTPASVEERDFLDMMLTNALAPVRTIELLGDFVPAGGVIAIMSSELGSVATNNGFWTLYSSSKAALNMLMKGFAGRRSGDPRAMLLVAPGWIRTDMGGQEATFSIAETIPLVADMVEASRSTPGLHFCDRFGQTLSW